MSLFWLCMEWGGVILALSAAYLMSKNTGQEKLAWCIFLVADFVHALFYMHTNQTGLVYNQGIGFFIAILGLTVLCNKENKLIQNVVNRLINLLIVVFAMIGIYFIVQLALVPSFKNLEWVAAFVSLTGTTLMASTSKYARFGFFGWLFCDLSMLYVAVIKSQFGIIFLRVVYSIIDFNGIYQKFIKNSKLLSWKNKETNDKKEISKDIAVSY